MSTSITVEQPLPVSIQLLSRISTYAHVFESVLAIVLFWLFPSLEPKMPECQITFRRRSRRYSASIHSVKSMASTLVDEDMTDKEDNESDVEVEDEIRARRRFYMLSAPMMKSKSLSLMPFARRMSLPAKRFSEHFATAMSSPFQTPYTSPFQSPYSNPFNSPLPSPIHTPSSEFGPTCYFSPLGHRSEHVYFDEDQGEEETQIVVERIEKVEYSQEQFSSSITSDFKNVGRVKKMKRVTRRAKSFLRFRHH